MFRRIHKPPLVAFNIILIPSRSALRFSIEPMRRKKHKLVIAYRFDVSVGAFMGDSLAKKRRE
jgi:hypothetical protein